MARKYIGQLTHFPVNECPLVFSRCQVSQWQRSRRSIPLYDHLLVGRQRSACEGRSSHSITNDAFITRRKSEGLRGASHRQNNYGAPSSYKRHRKWWSHHCHAKDNLHLHRPTRSARSKHLFPSRGDFQSGRLGPSSVHYGPGKFLCTLQGCHDHTIGN